MLKVIGGLFLLGFYSFVFGQAAIDFPIEVFHIKDNNDEWINTTEISFETKDFTGDIKWLYVKVNNLNEAEAMKYRVKKSSQDAWGDWQVSVPDFSQFTKDAQFGGLNGGFGTTEFTTPIAGIESNQSYEMQFQYVYVAGRESSGYRILDLGLWTANNKLETNQILSSRNDITGADWAGPYASDPNRESYASDGGKLWRGETEAQLIDLNGVLIQATCADCHASTGWDLKYFNYSDNSIIARSNFHGLSRVEGEKIAQYIRDLSAERSINGRPWQPPFQPGPNADSDSYEWAAGQGLENVLESDQEMISELFGVDDPSEDKIREVINGFSGNTNTRTQKLSVQFPDWNMWLPKIHPKDLVGTLAIGNGSYSPFTNKQAFTQTHWESISDAYDVFRTNARKSLNNEISFPYYNDNELFRELGAFAAAFTNLLRETGPLNNTHPGSPNWADSGNQFGKWEGERETLKQSLAAWYSLKLFEVIHEFELHNIDLEGIPSSDQETFQWPSREWSVFQNAAHIISEDRGSSYFALDENDDKAITRSIYLSSIWYQMQMTLTPGHRKGSSVTPNDFAYNHMHIHRLGERTGYFEPARFTQNYIKSVEQRNNGLAPNSTGNRKGWNMREASPWRLYASAAGNTQLFDDLGESMKFKIRDVLMGEISNILNGFKEADWDRVSIEESRGDFGGRTDSELENRDIVPENGVGGDCLFMDRRGGNCGDGSDAVEVDAIYTLLEVTKEGAISETVFNNLRSWADDMWDYSDWPVYQVETTEPEDTVKNEEPKHLLATNENKPEIKLGPNPFLSTIQITGIQNSDWITVLTLQGRQVFKEKGVTNIDLSFLSDGIYLVQINNDIHKVVKH